MDWDPFADPADEVAAEPAVEPAKGQPCAQDEHQEEEEEEEDEDEEAIRNRDSMSYAVYIADLYADDIFQGRSTRDRATGPRKKRSAGAPLDADFEARREVAEANRRKLSSADLKLAPPFHHFYKPELEERAKHSLEGDVYGVVVPATLSELEQLGGPWLTRAFHAAGTLPEDNWVLRIVSFERLPTTTVSAKGGAGPKACITVQYASPDPDLHTKLFVKMPWAVDGSSKEMGGDPIWRYNVSQGDSDSQECYIYRMLAPILPFKIPKCYFADVCRENTNYILVTEWIEYADNGQTSFKPYEILPAAVKFFDFQLDKPRQADMYFALLRAQARLAAWDKLGFFNQVPAECRGLSMVVPPGTFPWPEKLEEKQRAIKVRLAKSMAGLWREYLAVAKKCYEPEVTEEPFLDALVACIEECGGYVGAIKTYYATFPEMTALQHVNLQPDNAYFWRNSDGRMDCGLLDWGGAGPQHFVFTMLGCINAAEADVLDEHEEDFMRCFRDEFYQECGIRLNVGEMVRQWHLGCIIKLVGMGSNISKELFRECPEKEWATIESLWDERVLGRWSVRCYAFMIHIMLKYLHLRWVRHGRGHLHVHNTFLDWKYYWEFQGMT